jgi:membrane protease YdiL (CAAX protease family)
MVEALSPILKSWLILAATFSLPAAIIWFVDPKSRHLPSQRQRSVPWTGFEICAIVLAFIWWLLFFSLVLKLLSDYWPHLQKDDSGLAVSLLSLPLQIATILVILRKTSRARSYQLGITTARWTGNLVLGFWAWLLTTPLVYLIEVGYQIFRGMPAPQHQLTTLLQGHPTRLQWLEVICQAILVGPVFEELLFRGVIQPWCTKKPQNGQLVLLAALLLALFPYLSGGIPGRDAPATLAPAVFVLSMAPAYYVLGFMWKNVSKSAQAVQAVYSTSLLFAAAHSNVWPTPIPLFFLGMALGWLAYRTQSLIGPIFVHGLFNSVTCLALALTAQEPAEPPRNGSPATSAELHPFSQAISTLVPGS